MADVLIRYEQPVTAPDGRIFRAQACGAQAPDGTRHWEGWLEFIPIDGGDPVRSGRETTQPNQTDTHYWATGLSPVFLEGSLKRALDPARPASPSTPAVPIFDGPAPAMSPDRATPSVLDPFSVYRKGERLLRSQLAALSGWHLINIIRAHHLSDLDDAALERIEAPDLADLIVSAVRARQG